MITEEYVTLEIAKLLKEKGFNEDCYTYYDDIDNNINRFDKGYHFNNTSFPWGVPYNISESRKYVVAPTHQMAMKWLREVHKCYITFTWEFKEYDKNYKPIYKDITWSFNIAIPKYNSARKGDGDYFNLDSDKEYDSYEQACEAAIKYCLENLI